MPSLPVLASPKKKPPIRASRTARWRAAVLIAVQLLIAAHIAYWLSKGSAISPVEPSEAIAFSRSGVINAGFLFFAASIVLTAIFGRFFCGWACHLVALQDASRWLLEKFGHRPTPLRSRFLAWIPTVSFLYLFGWPLYRRLAGGDALLSGPVEVVTTEFWARFPGWTLALLTFFVCGFAIIYFLGAKGFCTYACPYGAAFAAADRLAPLRIRVTDACEGCGHCTAVCTSNIRVHEEVRDFGMVKSAGCMKCMDCVSVCPNDALYYGLGAIPLLTRRRTQETEKTAQPPKRTYSLALWEEVLLAAMGLTGYLTFRGLYGAVPILMALGAAAVFAFLSLLFTRLFVQQHMAFKGWRLKRNHKLLPAGRAAILILLLPLGFFTHSAWMRWTLHQGETAYARLAQPRSRAFDLASPAIGVPARDLAESTLLHYQRLEKYGLVSTFAATARIATLSLLLGDFDTAHRAALDSLQRKELEGHTAMVLATVEAKRSQFEEALLHYDRALRAFPILQTALVGRGLILAELGRFEDAAENFRMASQQYPRSSELAHNLGLASLMSGDLHSAIDSFAKAVELAPNNRASLDNWGGALAQAGRFDEARSAFERSLALQPNDIGTATLLARALIELNLLQSAREILNQILVQDPSAAEARTLLQALRH